MNVLAATVVVAFGLFLIGLAGVMFTRREVAERFIMSFARSARAHFTEQSIRLLVGASLVALAPSMLFAGIFRILGWLIVGTSVALMLTPWQWHHRLGRRVLPILVRHLKAYAVLVLLFGGFLLYGVRGP